MGSGDIIYNQSGLVWHGRVKIHVIIYLIGKKIILAVQKKKYYFFFIIYKFKDNWEADDKLEVYFNGN